MGTDLHTQSVYDTTPYSVSPGTPFRTFVPHMGVAQSGPGNIAQHGSDADVPQRPPFLRFASSGSIVGSPFPNVLNDPRVDVHTQQPPFPPSPQLDIPARKLSLEDSPAHLGRYLQPQQQPYGVPPPLHLPAVPAPMGNIQYPYRCLNHVEASRREYVTLDMLEDPARPGEKPNFPYPLLIRAAIQGSPKQALTLQGIYDALQQRYEWFREHKDDKAWLVRHQVLEHRNGH